MAHAMLSLPATKGFEIGSGFDGCTMRGSVHNDPFVARPAAAGDGADAPAIMTSKNHAGGTLGGISSGADVYFRVAVKPVSTIGQAQTTSTFDGKEVVLEAKGRHDPCVLPRTPPLVEGMAALVLADCALLQRTRAPRRRDDDGERRRLELRAVGQRRRREAPAPRLRARPAWDGSGWGGWRYARGAGTLP